MTTKLTNDFKAAFALLLSIMKVNYSTTTALNYSQTVYEWTLAGLITEGKVIQLCSCNGCELKDADPANKYAAAFNYAEAKYSEAIRKIEIQATPGRKEWAQAEILDCCFKINKTIFPIALKEGLLDLKDIAVGIGAGAGNLQIERDR